MKKSFLLLFIFFIFLSTYNPNFEKTSFSKFNIKRIVVENSEIVDKNFIKQKLSFLYDQNLFFLNINNIQKEIQTESFVESFVIKKIYPNTLKLILEEKKPIAILIENKKKYFVSDKGELIKFKELQKFKNLPTILNGGDDFYLIYQNLKNINFPLEMIKSYHYFESGRWDLIISENKIIKLPIKNYQKSLKNFMKLKQNKEFYKYNLFDYRIEEQVILN